MKTKDMTLVQFVESRPISRCRTLFLTGLSYTESNLKNQKCEDINDYELIRIRKVGRGLLNCLRCQFLIELHKEFEEKIQNGIIKIKGESEIWKQADH